MESLTSTSRAYLYQAPSHRSDVADAPPLCHVLASGPLGGAACEPADLEAFVALLRDIDIVSDPRDRTELKNTALPLSLRQVRYFDAATGEQVASFTDNVPGRALSGADVADTLTYHADYLTRRWIRSMIRNVSGDTLDLDVTFGPVCE